MDDVRIIATVSPPIFFEYWWLKIAVGSSANQDAIVRYRGDIIARMPYGVRTRMGFRSVGNCDWTPVSGPRFSPGVSICDAAQIVDCLVGQLPRSSFSRFTLPGNQERIEDVKYAFTKAGYRHSLMENYTRAPASDLHGSAEVERHLLATLSKKVRKHLQSASKRLEIDSCEPDVFVKFYADNLKENIGEKSRHPLNIAEKLLDASAHRRRGEIFVAKQPNGMFDAAVACVWDQDRYYLWMATRRVNVKGSTTKPNSDAIKLLVIKAMARAQELNLTFDADSPGTPGAQMLYKEILKLDASESRHVFIRHTFASSVATTLLSGKSLLRRSWRFIILMTKSNAAVLVRSLLKMDPSSSTLRSVARHGYLISP